MVTVLQRFRSRTSMPEKNNNKKIFLFPSSDVICLRRENNTSHHSYLGLIREEGQACCLPRGREMPGQSC